MNAMTADDLTLYCFSSENKSDYANLMAVYLDACFAPRLRRLDFMQEGWRLEHKKPSDTSSPLAFKGVVYNEMKGHLADNNALFYTRHQQELYRDSPYAFVSGGDPEFITDLTHERLVGFYNKHYHPSNARFYTYGSFPLQEQMYAVEQKLLEIGIKPLDRIAPLGDVSRWSEPRLVKTVGPLDPMGDASRQNRVAVSFLTNPSSDTRKSFAMQILTSLLTDGAASPLYKALIEAKLGSDFAPTTGYSQEAVTSSLSFGLQGVATADIPVVIEAIHSVLQSQQSFPQSRIDSIFHQIEMQLKHRSSGFGMKLGFDTLRSMVHACDPLEAMDVSDTLDWLRAELKQPGFFGAAIKEMLLDNPHRLTFVMEPDASYADELVAQEKARLQTKVAQLTAKDQKQIFDDGLELLKLQNSKEDLSCLPCLPLSAVSTSARYFSTQQMTLAKEARLSLAHRSRVTETNSVSYVYLKWDISALSDYDKLHIPLLCEALTSLGTGTKSHAELDESIRFLTGGISASPFNAPDASNSDAATDYVMVSTNALDRNLAEAYALLVQVVSDTRWTALDELKTCLVGTAANYATSVPSSGHLYAMKSAAASLRQSTHSAELFSGMKQVQFLDSICQSVQTDAPQLQVLAERLKSIATRVFSSGPPTSFVVSTSEVVQKHEALLSRYVMDLAAFEPRSISKTDCTTQKITRPVFENLNYPMDLGVNFTARAFMGVPYTNPDSASLRVLASLMTSHFMHCELREKGGAYGGGARYNPLDGIFYMMTYRDPPSVTRTLGSYEASISWAHSLSKHISASDLDQAKLDCFKTLDRPVDASDEGLASFQYALDKETLQRHRDALFGVSVEDVQRVACKYLSGRKSSVCIIGEEFNPVATESQSKSLQMQTSQFSK